MELEIQLSNKEEKIEELYQQIQTLEKERQRLRSAVLKYEEENKNCLNTMEESKIEVNELKKQIEIYENKLHAQQESREDKLTNQITTIKELEQEIELKNKKIRDLLKDKQSIEKRCEEDY